MISTHLLSTFLIASAPVVPSAAGAISWTSSPVTISMTSASHYHVSRRQRTPDELVDRARDIIAVFSDATPNADRLDQWAHESLAREPHRWLKVHPLPEDARGLVVMYQPLNDDLMIMDLDRLHRPPWPPNLGPEPVIPQLGIGEVAARGIMEDTVLDLQARGIIADGFSPASARLGVYRERVRAGAEVAEWVMEYQWTMNRIVDGIEFIDAGIRVGIHHDGGIASLRVTDVAIEPVEGSGQPLVLDAPGAREAFVDAEQAEYPSAFIHVARERMAIVLDPDQNSAILAPGLLFNYSLRFENPATGTASVSRQRLTTVSLTTGIVHEVFPIPSAP